MKKPLCSGEGCPLKDDCDHYSQAIDKMRDDFFDKPPYRLEFSRCSFNPKDVEGSYSLKSFLNSGRL